jgi:hypothetical protein
MAYDTGSASGVAQLLDALRVFLLAQGWTVNLFGDDGAGKRLHVQKGSDTFVNFRAAVGEFMGSADLENASTNNALWMNGSTGYNGALARGRDSRISFLRLR